MDNIVAANDMRKLSARILRSVILLGLASSWPHLALAQSTSTALANPIGQGTGLWDLFSRVAGWLNFVTGALALIFIVLGGYRILTAAGNSEHFARGKKMISYALLGLILTVGSYAILSTTINVLSGGATVSLTSQVGLVDPLNLYTNPSPVFELYGGRLLKFLLGGLGGLTVLMFVYGGLLWLLAAGNEERISQSKRVLLYAVIGLVVVLSSYIFTSFAYAPLYQLLSH